MDLLRRKLALEPQIHGGKRTRVVFNDRVDEGSKAVIDEGSAHRSDR